MSNNPVRCGRVHFARKVHEVRRGRSNELRIRAVTKDPKSDPQGFAFRMGQHNFIYNCPRHSSKARALCWIFLLESEVTMMPDNFDHLQVPCMPYGHACICAHAISGHHRMQGVPYTISMRPHGIRYDR